MNSTTNSMNPTLWNTNAITPGTLFMKQLAQSLQEDLVKMKVKWPELNLILSTAEEPGEGEHKLFQHLRKNPYPDGDIVVYGLDADLIMLSLLHTRYAKQGFWIFREAPHFDNKGSKSNETKSNNSKTILEKDECLHLDIPMLSRCILQELGSNGSNGSKGTIDDYVFLCFFLGNDFLPHFPCLNIRTHGMPALIDMYKDLGEPIIRNGQIWMPSLHAWIRRCAAMEVEWFRSEKETRDKMAKTLYLNKDNMMDQIPLLFRGEEAYINAGFVQGWEQRYYKVLFPPETRITHVTEEYMKGLEWVWTYYTQGCTDWRWQYKWSYPPLMADLAAISPNLVQQGPVDDKANGPVHPWVQLAYVLPQANHHLIPCKEFTDRLAERFDYGGEPTYIWAYCRYFWEAHVHLSELNIDEIQNTLQKVC